MFVVATVTLAAVQPAQAKCGTRGGPGYRHIASNQCVSWKDVGSRCGDPIDRARCAAEKVAPGADDAAKRGIEIEKLKSQQRKTQPK